MCFKTAEAAGLSSDIEICCWIVSKEWDNMNHPNSGIIIGFEWDILRAKENRLRQRIIQGDPFISLAWF